MTFLFHVFLLAAGLMGLWAAPRQAPPTLSARFDLDRRVHRFDLPGRLREVSGLAFDDQGRLLAHGDEQGVVYRVDPGTGDVDRGFQVGERPIADDFEGMALVGPRLFLVSSKGVLYETRLVAEGGWAPVRVTDSGVGAGCEVEGLAYHASIDALLLACKTLTPQAPEVRIHRLPLSPDAPPLPPLRIPWRAFAPWDHGGEVNPSGMDVDPATGMLVLVAARQELIFQVDAAGALLDVVRLRGRRHPQVEGIAFGPDGLLWLGDEGGNGDGRVTAYGPHRPTGGPP